MDVAPERRFGGLDDVIARRRQRAAGWERDDGRPDLSADLAGDILDRVWDDVPDHSAAGDVLDRIWRDPWVERDREELDHGL